MSIALESNSFALVSSLSVQLSSVKHYPVRTHLRTWIHISLASLYAWTLLVEKTETRKCMWHYKTVNSTKNSTVDSLAFVAFCARIESRERLSKFTVDLKGPKLNVLIRDRISFVSASHLTCVVRSCSMSLYRYQKGDFTISSPNYNVNFVI